jgi:hypothetical protein
MSELTKMLSTACGLIEENESTDTDNTLPCVSSGPLISLSMEPRTISHCEAVDHEDTCIYYNCDHFKSKFNDAQNNNQIHHCNSLLHRTLSCKDMYEARNIIFEFLHTRSPNSMCLYGSSSWGMVGHGLYCDDSGKLYGYYSGSFGLTIYSIEKHYIENMFEEDDERLTKINTMTF